MKRTICMLLVLALITGMMPINVWAEETETSESVSAPTSVEGIESVEQSDESTTSTETQETESVPVDTSVEVTELAEQSEETTVSEETGSYPVINADETTTVEISTGGEYAYFSFTPTYTESYTFYSTGSYDTYGYLYDSDMSQLAYNDDGGESSNYSITYTLEAGVTYIWAARFYSSSKTGSFDVMLQTNHSGEGVVTNSNSCTEDGLMTYTCAVCGEVYTEIIPAAGHTWESEVTTPNSCTEEGLMTYTCSVCEETYTELIPSSHTWNDDRVCSVCGALFYDSGSCGNDLTWSLDNLGTLTISGSGSMTAYSSDSEAPWYEYSEIITELIISNNVTNLSRYGFRYFEKLEKIYFNATAMNDLAYSGIFYRTGSDSPGVTVVIGANVTRIPSNLFSNGSYSPDWDASWNCNGVTSVIFEEGSKCETIGNNAFSYCYSLNSIAIPESVTSIGNYAFFNCQNLLIQIEASALPETLGSYWDHGAAICMNVVKFGVTDYGQDYWITGDNTAHVWKYRGDDTTVVIPETIEGVPVVEIATSAFATIIRPHLDPNGKITYVEIPDSVTTINSFAFDSCVGLEKIIIPESVEYIGESAFYYCKNATEIRFNAIAMDNLESDNDVFSRAGENIDGITVTIGSNVTQIPDYLFYDSNSDNAPNLTAVVFEEGSVCESIGIHAFHHCDTLSQITLPESITIIGESAFYNCTGLTQIQIPENVKTMGQYAFYNCTGLSSIYYNTTAMEDLSGYTAYPDAFAYAGTNGNGIVVTIGENVTYIPGNLFKSPASRCAQITEVVFEDGSQCTGIGAGAFYGCAYLTNISIPENVRNFGSSVFAECSGLNSAGPVGNGYNIEFSWNYSIPANTFSFSNLTEITLPDSISSIGSYAFAYCKGLSGIDLPTELIAIGEMSFIGCSGLLGISIPEKVETIDDEAFKDCSALTEIVFNAVSMNDLTSYNEIFYNAGKNGAGIAVSIGASCSKLPAYLFNPYSSSYAPNITSVVFDKNSNCRIIGRNAFAYLSLVTEIEIPTSVTSIGTYAFRNCTALANITIPESVTSIDENVFYSCTNLNSAGSIGGGYNIEFGWTESIPANAFHGCTSLTEVELPASVSEIGSYAFYGGTGLNEITIPANVTNLGTYSFYGCTNVENLYFNATAMDNLENSNYVFGNLGTGTDGVTVTVGANATRIPNYLFCPYVNDSGKVSNSPNVTKVVFEEGSVCYRIGSYAFYGCSKLTDIELPDSVTVIGAYAFNGCPINMSNITVSSVGDYAFYGCTSITSVTITGGTTSVGKYAFYGTGLTSVTIPVSVTVIEDYAFGDISALEDVYYGGSEAQWAAIEIGEGNASLADATIHYNCDVPDTNGEVRYFYKWDAENQIAYFETDPEKNPLNFGSQVTEETDTSFLENVDELVGTYVLVKTQARDDGMLLPDTLISIKPLETYIGVVTAISTTDGTITIDGTPYAYTFDWLETVPEVGDYVKYRLYEGKIVSLEIVENSSTQAILYFSRWNEENQMVYFGRDGQSMAAVTDETDTSFLNELDALLGRYVLVDLNVVDSTTELVSIKAVDTNVGTVSAVDATSVTIDGMTYTVDVGVLSGIAVDDYILYHIYEDKIIAVEVLSVTECIFVGWNSDNNTVSIKLYADDKSEISYQISLSASNETKELLDNLIPNTRVRIAYDTYDLVHSIKEVPFSKAIYHADNLLEDEVDNLDYFIRYINQYSPAVEILNNGDVDDWAEAWEELTLFYDTLASGDAYAKREFKQIDVYEAILLNALQCATSDDSAYAWGLSVTKKTTSVTKDLLSRTADIIESKYNWQLATDAEIAGMTAQEKAEFKDAFEEALQESSFKSAVLDLKASVDFVSEIMEIATTASDLIDKVSVYLELWYVSDSMATVLDEMLLKIPETEDFSAMRSAVEFCKDMIRETNQEQFKTDALIRANFMTSGKYAVSEGISFLWEKIIDKALTSNPELTVLLIAYNAARTVTKYLFGTDNITEELFKLRAVSQYTSFLESAILSIENKYTADKTEENANTLLNAVSLLHALAVEECDVACSYADAVEETAAHKITNAMSDIIATICGTTDDSDAKTTLKEYASSLQQTLICNNVDAATHWVYHLESDFPQYYSDYAELIGDNRYEDALVVRITSDYVIECPVDVRVYNSSGMLVVELYGDGMYVLGDVCLSIRNCIKRAPKSTVPGQHRFGFEKPQFL